MNPDGEDAWLRLKQHLKWCDHFALGFIFTNHSKVVHIFRERLAGIYRARVTRLKNARSQPPVGSFQQAPAELDSPAGPPAGFAGAMLD